MGRSPSWPELLLPPQQLGENTAFPERHIGTKGSEQFCVSSGILGKGTPNPWLRSHPYLKDSPEAGVAPVSGGLQMLKILIPLLR